MNDLRHFLRAEWDRVAGYGCIAVGIVLLIAGFVGVRTSADVIDEISYLVTGGIGSIFLLGVGATLLLSADLHDDFRKLHRVEQKLDRVERLLQAEHPELLDSGDPPSGSEPEGARQPVRRAEPKPAVAAGVGATLAVRRGRLFAGLGIAVAAVLFAAGAIRTADQPTTDHMAGSVGLALAGALLVAFVAVTMVAQLRTSGEQRKVAVFGNWLTVSATGRAEAAMTAVDAAPTQSEAAPAAVVGGTPPVPRVVAGTVFVVPGLPFYHRAGCQLLHDRPAAESDRAAVAPGTSPCRLCEPS
jgi:hypothetical protein